MTLRKDAAPRGSSGFAGDLEALSVADLIQTLVLGGRTGRVTLTSGDRQGEMWFVAGTLVHAEAPPHFGEPAAYEMLGWTSGRFSALYGAETEARSVVQDTTYVVLEGLRRLDERAGSAANDSPSSSEPLRRAPRRRRAWTVPVLGLAALAGVLGVVILTMAHEAPTGLPAPVLEATDPFELAIPPAPEEPSSVPPAASPSGSTARARTRPSPAPVRGEPIPLGIVSVAETLPAIEADLPWPVPPPPPPISSLRIRVKSRVAGGALSIAVDGEEVFTRDLVRKGEEFEAVVPVPPGSHEVATRVDDPDRGGLFEESVRAEFLADAAVDLRVSAGRRFGSPVRVRIDASEGDPEDD